MSEIKEHRERLLSKLPSDQVALVQYIDMRFDANDKKTEEVLAAFNGAKFVGRGVAWLAAIGSGIAIIWSVITQGKTP
jgi:hypothetical protein